ncbi:MAG: fumarylacetoacetase, partial [Sphingomonadales bacterium]|nr:fumarylacetoacetase [Sphingomonadales bacterium]
MAPTAGLDESHDPQRLSWVESAYGHPHFPIQNLPLGIFSTAQKEPRIGCAIGDSILDLHDAAPLLDPAWQRALWQPSLNDWFAHGPAHATALRRRVSELLSDPAQRAAVEPHLVARAEATMHLPCRIGDYTDFYVGIHHATNVGRQFRPDAPLLPNY